MLQLLEPCWRAGLEGTGWSQDVEDTEQLAGTRGRAVMGEGTGPWGQEEGAGLCFSGGEAQEARTWPGASGLCWAPSQLELQHHVARGRARARDPLLSPGG